MDNNNMSLFNKSNLDNKLIVPNYQLPIKNIPKIKSIGETLEENTTKQTRELISAFDKQIAILTENYNKLSDLYNMQKQEYEDKKIELAESKNYNKKMFNVGIGGIITGSIIGILSLVATIVIAFIK